MGKLSQDMIHRESVRAVFECVCKKDGISRLEISEMTCLSLMTVGKIADELLERGLVTYVGTQNNAVGRRAKNIFLSRDSFILAFEVSEKTCKLTVFDISLSEREVLEKEYNGDIADCLLEFFVKLKIAGISDRVLCAGIVDNSGVLDNAEKIKSTFQVSECFIIDKFEAVQENFLKEHPQIPLNKSIVFHITESGIFAKTITQKGVVIGDDIISRAKSMVSIAAFTGSEIVVLCGDAALLKEYEDALDEYIACIYIYPTENADISLGISDEVIKKYLN